MKRNRLYGIRISTLQKSGNMPELRWALLFLRTVRKRLKILDLEKGRSNLQTLTFPEKAIGEVLPYLVSFSDMLQFGETINGASCTAVVFSGTDPTPQNIIAGNATFTASTVTQNVTGGVAGVVYSVSMIVTASGSHNYLKVFYVSVVPNSGLP